MRTIVGTRTWQRTALLAIALAWMSACTVLTPFKRGRH